MTDRPFTPERKRCVAQILVRDTWRVSRGHGFRMHYNRKQCSRAALDRHDFCRQHQKVSDLGGQAVMRDPERLADG